LKREDASPTSATTPCGRHEAGSHEKAAHHAHTAHAHHLHSHRHADEPAKSHLEEHGKK
jgi:hypothetical protein